MALLKSIALGESGVSLTYHKIVRTNSSHLESEKTEVIMGCFKDQESRVAASHLNNAILNTCTFILDGELDRASCYEAIKLLDLSGEGGINWTDSSDL